MLFCSKARRFEPHPPDAYRNQFFAFPKYLDYCPNCARVEGRDADRCCLSSVMVVTESVNAALAAVLKPYSSSAASHEMAMAFALSEADATRSSRISM
jgi:hypothetical protein